jgi:hypothetical protein
VRTIETTVTISPDGKLTIQLPPDIAPGDRRIVLVIGEPLEPSAKANFNEPKESDDPILGLGRNPISDSVTDAAENHDRYIYTGL